MNLDRKHGSALLDRTSLNALSIQQGFDQDGNRGKAELGSTNVEQ